MIALALLLAGQAASAFEARIIRDSMGREVSRAMTSGNAFTHNQCRRDPEQGVQRCRAEQSDTDPHYRETPEQTDPTHAQGQHSDGAYECARPKRTKQHSNSSRSRP